jgi:hypothetical protein
VENGLKRLGQTKPALAGFNLGKPRIILPISGGLFFVNADHLPVSAIYQIQLEFAAISGLIQHNQTGQMET